MDSVKGDTTESLTGIRSEVVECGADQNFVTWTRKERDKIDYPLCHGLSFIRLCAKVVSEGNEVSDFTERPVLI